MPTCGTYTMSTQPRAPGRENVRAEQGAFHTLNSEVAPRYMVT